jgi:hypothetical protein
VRSMNSANARRCLVAVHFAALQVACLSSQVFGQFEEPIETERKMFTPTTKTVAHREVMFEASYTFTDVRSRPEKHSYPETLLRYGITEMVEARFGWNLETEGEKVGFGRFAATGEQDFLYGIKVYLTEQDAAIPESSLILEGHTPKGGANRSQFHATYVFGWNIGCDCSLEAAARFLTESEEEDNFSEWSPSVVLNVTINERWETHWEYISAFSYGRDDEFDRHLLDAGLTHLVTDNIEISARIGFGLNDQTSPFLVNFGGGFRF